MQRLNLKLVVWLAAGGVIAVVAVLFLHQAQMRRTAGVLLDRAHDAEQDKDLESAVQFYTQYVVYKPEDYEESAKLALALADLAEQDNEKRQKYAHGALGALEKSLRDDPTRNDIRRRLADFAVLAGRPSDAAQHLKTLLKETPDDPELLSKLGACEVRMGREQEGVETLKRAIEMGGNQIDAYINLAVTLRSRLSNPTLADKVIEDMVAANPESAKAHLQRAQWLRETARAGTEAENKRVLDQIAADVAKAMELTPEDANTLLMAATVAAERNDLAKVRELMEKGHTLFPKDERMVQLLAEVAIAENKLDELDNLVEKMPDSANLKMLQFEVKIGTDKEQARKILDELEKSKAIDQEKIDYMRARMYVIDGKWLDATREFERLRPSMGNRQAQIDLVLGHCYEVLRQPDKQLEAYRRAITSNPNSLPAHIGLGRALLAVGQNSEALKELQGIKNAIGAEKFAKLVIARNTLLNLLIDQVSRLPEDQRNWTEVDEIMAASKKEFPDAADLVMLESKILEQKGNAADARKMLEETLAKDGKNVSAWLSLINLTYDKDGASGALKTLDEAQAAIGDKYELRAMRISCAAQMTTEEAKPLLAAAGEGLEKFTPEQQKQLRQLIGANYFRLREFGEARKYWDAIVKADPDDQQALLVLFDIGINEADDAKVVESIEAIKRLLGADSPEVKYVEARRSIALLRARKVADPTAVLKEARAKIRKAADERKRWSALPRVEAEIDIVENRPDDAIDNLRLAIEYGSTDYSVARQLAELLTMRGRAPEAQQVLAEAQSRAPNKDASATSDLIDVSIALSENDPNKAIGLLEQARAADPDDVRKIVWLAQIKAKAARYDESEALFREAIEKDANFSLTWHELVKLLRDQRRESDAREVINLCLEKMSKDQAELVAGQCYELLGDVASAEEHMIKARDAKPDDLGMSRALAMLYGRSKDYVKAREELERIMAAKPASPTDREQSAWANREVALMIAGRGAYSDMIEALKRLNEKDMSDRATMASILASRPEAESRMKAVRLLEDIKATTPLRPESRLVLAQLYDITGNWSKSKGEMLSLVTSFPEDSKYLGTFVEQLTDHDELQDASFWMEKLDALSPGTPLTSAVKAKLLVKQNKPEEAVAVLRNLLPRPMPRDMLPTLLQVAQLLESLKLNEAAEPMYREYKALNPEGTLVLAGFLGRNGSLKDALDMCEAAADTAPQELVLRGAMQILREQHGAVPKEEYARVEGWITKAIAKNPKSVLLKLVYAELLDLQQRYPELEDHYKALLANPEMVGQQRAIVLNNLAFLNAVQNKPGDSQKWINEAVQIIGPTSDLLDTRALVHLANNEVKEAIADLNMAMVDEPSGVKYFHLAQAQKMNNDTQAATESMKKALETYKVTRKDVAPAEQAKFDALQAELGLKL